MGDWDTNYPGQEQENIVIIKTDSVGNPQWTKFIPPLFYGIEAENILSLKNGGYIICGEQGTKNTWPSNYPVLYLAKLDDTGKVVWSNTYGYPAPPDDGYSALIMSRELPNGDIISCGLEAGALDDTLKGCILKVDSNGNEKWLRYYNKNAPPEQDGFSDIRPTLDGGFVSAGYVIGATENSWVVKVDSNGCDTIGCNYSTGINEVKEESGGVKVYPNPANNLLNIENISNPDNATLIVSLYDVLENKATEYSISPSQTAITENITNLAAGFYLYSIISENKVMQRGKLVIER